MARIKWCFLGLFLLVFVLDFGETAQSQENEVIDLQAMLKKIDISLEAVSNDRHEQLREMKKVVFTMANQLVELKTLVTENKRNIDDERKNYREETKAVYEKLADIKTGFNKELTDIKTVNAEIKVTIEKDGRFFSERLASFEKDVAKIKASNSCREKGAPEEGNITKEEFVEDSTINSKEHGEAISLISKKLNKVETCVNNNSKAVERLTSAVDAVLNPPPRDCWEIFNRGERRDGVYQILPEGVYPSFNVYCDMETDGGGWTVFQRRGLFWNPEDYFYREWKDYKEGFGDLNNEYWLGNDKIYLLTRNGKYELRVDLTDKDNGTAYAKYGTFSIDSEQLFYRLTIDGYSGTAGNSLQPIHNGMYFSTKDKSSDNCAVLYQGAWWYGTGCYHSNLNGLNRNEKRANSWDGICWQHWKSLENLQGSEMKIRPKLTQMY